MVSVCEADVYELFVKAAVLEVEFWMLIEPELGKLWAGVEMVPLAGHLSPRASLPPILYASYHMFLE
jgi:hypothetical protein